MYKINLINEILNFKDILIFGFSSLYIALLNITSAKLFGFEILKQE